MKIIPTIETTVICVSTSEQLEQERARLEADGFKPQKPPHAMESGGWMQGMIKHDTMQLP